MVKLRSKPVERRTFATAGRGAARHTLMPRSLARRWVPMSTASPDASQDGTSDRSRTSRPAPRWTASIRRSRSAGAVGPRHPERAGTGGAAADAGRLVEACQGAGRGRWPNDDATVHGVRHQGRPRRSARAVRYRRRWSRVLGRAADRPGPDPLDKAEIFRQLWLRLTYHPGKHLVTATVEPAECGFLESVRGPIAPKSPLAPTLLTMGSRLTPWRVRDDRG